MLRTVREQNGVVHAPVRLKAEWIGACSGQAEGRMLIFSSQRGEGACDSVLVRPGRLSRSLNTPHFCTNAENGDWSWLQDDPYLNVPKQVRMQLPVWVSNSNLTSAGGCHHNLFIYLLFLVF